MISVEGATKRFGDVVALDDVSLRAAPGEVLGLLGPNGAGKTTLVHLVATLLVPDAGTVHVDGLDVVRDGPEVRERIGLAGQFAALDELLTGRENLELIGELYGMRGGVSRERAEALLGAFGLQHAGDRRVGTYSGGMRRRLDLGATLIGDPSVLLLDEPTAGLDPRTREELWSLVDQVAARGTTVLLTSQHLDELDRLAHRVVVLDDGRVIADGTPTELKRRVGGHVVEARLSAVDALAPTVVVLEEVTGSTAKVDTGQHLVSVAATGQLQQLVDVAGALERAAVDPAELALRLPRLDDVFFELTGAIGDEAGPDGRADDDTSAGATPTLPAAVAVAHRHRPLRDVVVVTRRYWIRLLRTPQLLFFATVQPVLFVLGLSAVFEGMFESSRGGDYLQFLVPGVLVMHVVLAAGTTGVGLADDLKAGIIDRFRSLPMAPSAVIAGRTLTDLLRNVLAVALIGLAAHLMGFRLDDPVLGLAAAAVALYFGYAASWVFASVGLAVRDPQAAQFAGFAPVLPLVYLSSAWVPVETMTPAVRPWATHQPVNVTVEAVRSLTSGQVDGSALARSLLWSSALLVVFVVVATRQLSRSGR